MVQDEYWRAIVSCDGAFDDLFLYGVTTTGIFCRPSCKSRVPKKENVRIFKLAHLALTEGFRPCKRCRPEGLQLPAEEWIEEISRWIDCNFARPIPLNILAGTFHGSPAHLQRLFKRIKGISPNQYIRQKRLENASKALLATSKSIDTIAKENGFSNTPYFITLFKKTFGTTPFVYRRERFGDGC